MIGIKSYNNNNNNNDNNNKQNKGVNRKLLLTLKSKILQTLIYTENIAR